MSNFSLVAMLRGIKILLGIAAYCSLGRTLILGAFYWIERYQVDVISAARSME